MAQIGGARGGERNGYTTGNIPGNQYKLGIPGYTYDEVAITGWYNGNTVDKPLVSVFRFKNFLYRLQIANAIENVCGNPHIGYNCDQPQRYTLRKCVEALPGGCTVDNLFNVTTNCECECSSLVSLCFQCATGVSIWDQWTGTIAGAIRLTGLCDEINKILNTLINSLRERLRT